MSESTFIHLLIRGHVQRVWFRKSTEEKARSLGLRGWVRNCRDGRVELMARGERAAELRAWVEAGGPPAARVDHVEDGYAPAQSLPPSFEIRS
jgi:acylphosphatase